MKSRDDQPRGLEDIAAEWVVRRDAGFSPAARAEFERWLAADPRHALALAEMETALSALTRPRELGEARVVIGELADWERTRRSRQRRPRNVVAFSLVALGAAAAVIMAFLLPAQRRSITSELAADTTAVLRNERQVLSDGSIVELKHGAEIQVDFSPGRRDVRLLRGVAHFAVAQDAARPFVVSVSGVEVHAIGTEFAVHLAAGEVEVLVTEGRVLVEAIAPSANAGTTRPERLEPVLVAAGTRIVVPAEASSSGAARVAHVTPAEIESALAWRGMRLEFTGTPLAEALALFNRKSPVRISLADPTLADLRVSGIYWADKPEGFARLLETSLEIKAEREAPDLIVLRRH